MKTLTDKIIQPMLSEKVTKQQQKFNEYAVVVDKSLTKDEIRKAIKKIFAVEPLKIRTAVFRKKTKRTRYGMVPAKSYKKAMIRLPEGERLELK